MSFSSHPPNRYPSSSLKIHKYIVCELLGEGKFGKVFLGKNEKNGEKVALKMEVKDVSLSILKHETTILNMLYSKGCRNIPPVYWFGLYQNYYIFVMPCYDVSLDIYIHKLHSNPSQLCSFLKVFIKMITILQQIHKYYVVHRDIKPQNFMLKGNDLVLIDFGFSSFYVDELGTHKKEEYSNKGHLVGSLPYISYFVHQGYEVVRRDDVMSVLYILLFMLYGKLIWEDAPLQPHFSSPSIHKTDIQHPVNLSVKQMKQMEIVMNWITTSPTYQSEYEIIKEPLVRCIDYVYHLGFEEGVAYEYIMELFMPFL